MDRSKPPKGYTLDRSDQFDSEVLYYVLDPNCKWLDGLDCVWDEAVERAWEHYEKQHPTEETTP